jgi:hypothetical protein
MMNPPGDIDVIPRPIALAASGRFQLRIKALCGLPDKHEAAQRSDEKPSRENEKC